MKTQTIYQRPRVNKLFASTVEFPIVAVVAGAGYGKTTAAREYLGHAKTESAWITLTSGDADVFWDKLCDAIEPLDHELSDSLRVLGLPIGPWPVSRVVKLARQHCIHPFTICVDDYQLLPEDSPLHTLVETICFEGIPDLHLLLLSRSQPNIRLATLVSKDMACCIDASMLGFTEKETEGYLAMRGLRLTRGAVDSICKVSDGWISAIYLLGEGIRAGGSVQHDAIGTLFAENLMRPLAKADQDILLRLSTFDEFSLDFAVDVLGSERARDVIAALVR